MNRKLKLTLCLLTAMCFALVLYIAFHELGHMIVMLSAGATIDDFSIIGAHVSAHGGAYTRLSDLWLNANGAVFPLIVSFLYLAFYQRERNKTFYRVLSFFIGFVPIASLFAWVLIPFLFLSGHAPANDDVTKFLFPFSQTNHPLIVSAVAAVLIGLGVVLMIQKDVLKNYIFELKEAGNKSSIPMERNLNHHRKNTTKG